MKPNKRLSNDSAHYLNRFGILNWGARVQYTLKYSVRLVRKNNLEEESVNVLKALPLPIYTVDYILHKSPSLKCQK